MKNAFAKIVWGEFKCKTVGDYHDVYLTLDVLLTADAVQNFRNICLDGYSLDFTQMYTTPQLAWNAKLYETKQELQLLSDVNMHLFIEQSVKGDITECTLRHVKANNPNVND